MTIGHRIWVFPDGDLPPRDPYDDALRRPETHGHESLVVLNAGAAPTDLLLRVFFPDTEPLQIGLGSLPPRRVACYRLDEPIGQEKLAIPFGQYALLLESTHPVVAQLGRMDIRQPNLAYYTVMGFAAD